MNFTLVRSTTRQAERLAICASTILLLAGCSEASNPGPVDDDSTQPPPRYEVGGIVQGLLGGELLLNLNGEEDLLVTSDGAFQFGATLLDGEAWEITIAAQPTAPMERCTVTTGSGTIGGDVALATVVSCLGELTPLFPSAPNWNDYVLSDAEDPLDATGSPCEGADGGYDSCLHAGELRVLAIPFVDSCDGFDATDSLGALGWRCALADEGVVAVSAGLVDGALLSDLIDVDAETPDWRSLELSVSFGDEPALLTPATPWWPNPIVVDQDGMDAGEAAPYTIYLVQADATAWFTLDAEGAALVIPPGVTVTGLGDDEAVVVFEDLRFGWLEGATDSDDEDDDEGIRWDNVSFSVMRGVRATETDDDGIILWSSSNNKLVDLDLYDIDDAGLLMQQSNDNTVRGLISDDSDPMLELSQSARNQITDLEGLYGWGAVKLRAGADENTIRGLSYQSTTTQSAVLIVEASGNRLSDLFLWGSGVEVTFGAASNQIDDLRIVSAQGVGLQVTNGASGNSFNAVIIDSGTAEGVLVDASSDTTITGLTVSANQGDGVLLRGGDQGSTLIGVTSANNGGTGITVESAHGVTIHDLVAANNEGAGFTLLGGAELLVDDVASLDNGGFGFEIGLGISGSFTGSLITGGSGSGDCSAPTEDGHGLQTASGVGECLAPPTSSGLNLLSGATAGASFVGKLSIDDALNQSMQRGDGSAAFSGVLDRMDFERPHRGWGRDGGAFPDATNRGPCVAGELCQIWDWSLLASDALISSIASEPNGDDLLARLGTTEPSLRHATELPGDGVGDDDGLCETDEVCVLATSLGAYQGHGELVPAAPFVDSATGGITGVTLLDWESRGY